MSDEETYGDEYFRFLSETGETDEPLSDQLRESVDFYKSAIESMDSDASDEEVAALIRYIGLNGKIDLLKKVKAFYESRKFYILTDKLPSILSSHGNMKSVSFDDGSAIEIKTKVECRLNVPKEMSEEEKTELKSRVSKWVSDHGFSGAIKTHLDFEKGAFDERAANILADAGYSFTVDESIHPNTLKKIVTDIYTDSGEEPPSDIKFKVYSEAVMKKPKEKKF